jgi:hypothetical protein
MNEEEYQFNLLSLRESLAEQATWYPLLPGLMYTSLFDFVLQHGHDYRPVAWSGKCQRGVERQCYGNAITAGGRLGLKYVEGVAVTPDGDVIPHAWNADTDDELIDTTWLNTGLVYLGVEFSLERADDATWNGDAHILNDELQQYPVFRQRWQGEDYSLKWPFSDRLEALRVWRETGIYHHPRSIRAWLTERPRQAGRSNPLGGRQWSSGDGSQ